MIPALRAALQRSRGPRRSIRDLVRRLEMRTGATLGFPISETPCFFPQSLMASLAATGARARRPDPRQRRRDGGGRRRRAGALPGPGAGDAADVPAGRFRPGARRRRHRSSRSSSSCRRLRRSTASSSRSPKRIATRSGCRRRSSCFSTASTRRRYHALVAEAIVGDHDPAEVVLMEIEPRTAEDVARLRRHRADVGRARDRRVGGAPRGPAAVSTAATARRTPIKRIYNRVIPDELERKRHRSCRSATATTSTSSGPGIRRGISGSASSRFRACGTRRCRRRGSSTASRACRPIASASC